MSFTAVILAAGQSKRMVSPKTKVLHEILGDPSLLWVLRAIPKEVKNTVIVVNKNHDEIKRSIKIWEENKLFKTKIYFAVQSAPKGTSDALLSAKPLIDKLKANNVLILSADAPLITESNLSKLIKSCPSLGISEVVDPRGYGRVFIEKSGVNLVSIVEDQDATEAQYLHKVINSGFYALSWKTLLPFLKLVKNSNKQKELYLTDAINSLAKGLKIKSIRFGLEEISGLNTRADLSLLHDYAKKKINNAWLKQGVSILDPSNTFIGPRVKIGTDVLIEPNVSLIGAVSIGTGSKIQTGSRIEDSKLGNFTIVRPYTLIDRSVLTNHVIVGPFSRLREGTELADHVQIGNFVETKKAKISKGTKANHLTYLGDVSIGTNSNIGAGVITCNYDGVNKHKTIIGNDVFIGSNTQMIAPISVGDGALVAAGTTVTEDVPRHHKAKSRVPQVNRPINKAKK